MGLTRRPIRYLSGLSPIQALSLSCLITYSGSDIGGRVHKRHVRVQPRWIERCTRPCWTTTHTCTYTRYTQGGGVSTIRRISVRERPVLITSRATAVRKGFDFQIPSSLPPLLLLPRSMEEETRVWEFRVRSLGRSYRDCKSLSHSLNPPLDYSERESRPIERVCVCVCICTRSRPSSSLRSLLWEEEVVWRKNERPRRSAPSAFELRFPIKWIVPVAAPRIFQEVQLSACVVGWRFFVAVNRAMFRWKI